MTQANHNPRGNRLVIIAEESADICAFCKTTAELRPYGPNRERICFDCAMKDEATTAKRFSEDILGVEVHITTNRQLLAV